MEKFFSAPGFLPQKLLVCLLSFFTEAFLASKMKAGQSTEQLNLIISKDADTSLTVKEDI